VPAWCTGCGDHAILAAVPAARRDEGLRPRRPCRLGDRMLEPSPPLHEHVRLSRSSRRALPVAEESAWRRPDLAVFVNTGDGDCFSIGARPLGPRHRYNMNMTSWSTITRSTSDEMQASPTSRGSEDNTTPQGALLDRSQPLTVTLGFRTCLSSRRRGLDPGNRLRHSARGAPAQGFLVHPDHNSGARSFIAESVGALASRPREGPSAHARNRV